MKRVDDGMKRRIFHMVAFGKFPFHYQPPTTALHKYSLHLRVLTSHQLISPHQHGFLPGRFTGSQPDWKKYMLSSICYQNFRRKSAFAPKFSTHVWRKWTIAPKISAPVWRKLMIAPKISAHVGRKWVLAPKKGKRLA